jgi:hypothetical protein
MVVLDESVSIVRFIFNPYRVLVFYLAKVSTPVLSNMNETKDRQEPHLGPVTFDLVNGMAGKSSSSREETIKPFVFLLELIGQEISVHK